MPETLLSAERIEQIKERCQKATAAPWRGERRPFAIDVVGPPLEHSPTIVRMGCYAHNQLQLEADAQFIAEARSDIPVLIDEIERLRKIEEDAVEGAAALEAEQTENVLLKQLNAALRRQIGVPDGGSRDERYFPRASTWIKERENWEAEVNQLREDVTRLREENARMQTAITKAAREGLSHD